jgi:methylase of polypeptide subunit release factors
MKTIVTALAGLTAAMITLVPAPVRAQDEVPFITTPDHVTVAMLEIAGVNATDTVYDLGSGDGRIVITAARRFGARGLGVEIVPDLVDKSRANARLAGVADRADFRQQDLFATDLGPATVITMYLLPEVNLQLRPRLLALQAGTRIVSHDWDLGDWPPDRTLTLAVPDKVVGREKLSRVHLWVVPARLHGRWCAEGGADGGAGVLAIEQRYQQVQAVWERAAERQMMNGRIDGVRLRLLARAAPELTFDFSGDRLAGGGLSYRRCS